ncbi:MAG TPA: pentapeptide repeat-containing protein [Cyanothece sp. UBA12306]|nr:pentapeptide repeat-containing protein [Cyanothece sp. UBA12306]
MSEFPPTLHLLASHNPYPECVSLQVETLRSKSVSEQLTVLLQIHFNEQEKSLLNGHLKFALKGGLLSLEIENGEVVSFESYLEDWGKLQIQSPVGASWQLTAKPGTSILKTGNVSLPLAIIQPKSDPLSLKVILKVTPQDLCITQAEGLWRHDIHPNQHGILERVLARFLHKTRLSSHLCYLALTTATSEHSATAEQHFTEEIDSHELAQLHQLLEHLYELNSHDFRKLSELANLNPLTDLAGGNFVATELSGVELSGANLDRSNFRGANLTDADLSEAVLNYGKFNGADLSGAYLGNAQLVQADFHRASLAVANLIGANLTEANLVEANLIEANLSGAKVTGAKFGNNPGITPEIQQDLRERGAIFVDVK